MVLKNIMYECWRCILNNSIIDYESLISLTHVNKMLNLLVKQKLGNENYKNLLLLYNMKYLLEKRLLSIDDLINEIDDFCAIDWKDRSKEDELYACLYNAILGLAGLGIVMINSNMFILAMLFLLASAIIFLAKVHPFADDFDYYQKILFKENRIKYTKLLLKLKIEDNLQVESIDDAISIVRKYRNPLYELKKKYADLKDDIEKKLLDKKTKLIKISAIELRGRLGDINNMTTRFSNPHTYASIYENKPIFKSGMPILYEAL